MSAASERALATLDELGVLQAGAPATAVELSGGVSCESVAVRSGGLHVVVKRALPRLLVDAEWLANDNRLATEAVALRLMAGLTPDAVPPVIALAEDGGRLVVAHAPEGWRDWRSLLLEGVVDRAVGARLGTLLATWQRSTTGVRLPELESLTGFTELRIDPFHQTVARKHPELADRIDAVSRRLLETRRCLVHGDFSPKNVLVGDDGLWVIDWEIAHVGDPVFDVAFLCSHLLLKSIHRRNDVQLHREAAAAFLAAYGELDELWLAANVGCLLLARVDGKSPAPYLREDERRTAREFGRSLLLEPPPTLVAAWGFL